MADLRPPSTPASPTRRLGGSVALGAAVIVVAVLLAYANTLTCPFVYDDKPSIVYNPTILRLWPLTNVLVPPGAGATVSGRPVLNLTFALNYACHGLDVRGYHAVNIAIHLAAALTLFGLVRRALRRCTIAPHGGVGPDNAALIVALLWAVHPMQTEAVTYLVQRAESLMALFYLLTLYAFVRAMDSPRPARWLIVSWAACLLGMGTKENMVSAPLALLLFDRAFVAGSFASAWRQRRGYYLALGATWLLLIGLVLSTGGDRGGSAGFGLGVTWVGYAMTQFSALARYGALIVWPFPLVFDYGPFFIERFQQIAIPALAIVALLAVTGDALVRRPKLGFVLAVALGVLAPTSLIPGTTQMIVEHRMYLPLACALALVPVLPRFGTPRFIILLATAIAVALAVITSARNRTYATAVALWADTAAKRPNNPVAHASLGAALADVGRPEEAMAEDKRALALNPDYGPALANLAVRLEELGRPSEALAYAAKAVERQPISAQAHVNLGVALDMLGRAAEALPQFETAVQLNPLLPAAHNDLGDALSRVGKSEQGIAHLREALRLQPDYRNAYFNLAAALARAGQMADAQAEFAAGVRLNPSDPGPHVSWATFLLHHGHALEALAEYEAALKLDPSAATTHYDYATALAGLERYDEAIREYEAAIRCRAEYPEAHNNLANTLAAAGRLADAIPEYQAALRLRPDDANTHNNLGLALARSGKVREAAGEFEAAVRLAPDFAKARENLARARAQLFDQLNAP